MNYARILIVSLAALFLTAAEARPDGQLSRLVRDISNYVEQYDNVLNRQDRRDVTQYLHTVRSIFESYGLRPDPGRGDQDISKIYSCSNDPDPVLSRRIYDSRGALLRNEALKTFTDGDDPQEKRACQNELLQSNLNSNLMGSCKCSNDNDPVLYLEILDSRYQTISKMAINTFTIGDDVAERSDCYNMINKLSICTLR